MRIHVPEREQVVPGPVDEVFAFFSRAHNLQRITPPWLRFQVLTPGRIDMGPGTLIEYRLRVHAVPVRLDLPRPRAHLRLSQDGRRAIAGALAWPR